MLEGKVAIITGGTRGIGLEIARLFKENNAEVIIFGSKKESIDKAIETLNEEGHQVIGYYPNLSDYNESREVISSIEEFKYKFNLTEIDEFRYPLIKYGKEILDDELFLGTIITVCNDVLVEAFLNNQILYSIVTFVDFCCILNETY